jgi:hypothetical protein
LHSPSQLKAGGGITRRSQKNGPTRSRKNSLCT